MANDEPDMPGDGQADERPPLPPFPPMPRWLAVALVAALFAGGLIESTRRSVRSTAGALMSGNLPVRKNWAFGQCWSRRLSAWRASSKVGRIVLRSRV